MDEQVLPTTEPNPSVTTAEQTVPEVTDSGAETKKRASSKKRKFVQHGQAHILATYNNTHVTLTDLNGNVLVWSSAGKCGFKGPKKSTPYAAGVIVRDVMERAKPIGLKQVEVYVRGVGMGREAAIRALAAQGLVLTIIKDITPMPHNGPRPRKARRV